MKDQCFDEGTIQAFLDGELDSPTLENVARHVALCETCAMMLAETEEESAFAFAALDNELNSLVPTERIRASVYHAISEVEKPKVSFWEKITSFGFILSSPQLAAFGGLLIVAGMTAILLEYTGGDLAPKGNIARLETTRQAAPVSRKEPETIAQNQPPTASVANDLPVINASVQPRSNSSRAALRPKYQNAKFAAEIAPIENTAKTPTAPAELLSGEDTYLKTIATLNKTVDGSKDAVLDPSSRVSYEKDLAMVNDAITKMRREVRRNPKNEVAREVLRNSYQNKIDLLNSVAERGELFAGLE